MQLISLKIIAVPTELIRLQNQIQPKAALVGTQTPGVWHPNFVATLEIDFRWMRTGCLGNVSASSRTRSIFKLTYCVLQGSIASHSCMKSTVAEESAGRRMKGPVLTRAQAES